MSLISEIAGRPSGVPMILGGHLILRELGRGTRGMVYVARQLSLNCIVALKVMKAQWASDSTFVASFTREFYAAAQLTHPNLVSNFDFGEDKGRTYFSREFVEGLTSAELVRDKQCLDVDEAVGYILQAARGLKCAHDQGMIHRDIRPENLLLNGQGVVKVADLGLVLTPEVALAEEGAIAAKPASAPGASSATGLTQITPASAAPGTPGYMAPEQGQAAAHVDRRADIYSLGCTLCFLLTGQPPSEGQAVLEALDEYHMLPSSSRQVVAKRVPNALSAIIRTMTAAKPGERYADLADVIRDLEGFLGIPSAGPFKAREEHVGLMEQSVKAWNESPSARTRARVMAAILGACFGFALLCMLPRWWLAASAFFSLGIFIALADFVFVGAKGKTPLFKKVSALVLGSSRSEWLTSLVSVALLLGLFFVLKLFWIWVALGLAAIGIAMGLQVGLDVHAAAERRVPLEQVEQMLKSLRLQGHDEDVLRHFVCKYSGNDWEELYEVVFGYEAKLAARERWGRGERAKARVRFAAWRDPIVRWIDARLAARREAKERAVLQKIEERRLESEGANLVTARRKAERSAGAMVATAAEIRETIRARDGTIMVNRSIVNAMREAAIKPERVLIEHERGLIVDRARARDRNGIPAKLAGMVFGPKIRFLAGATLVAGSIAWMHQNALISSEHAKALVEAAKAGDIDAVQSHAQAGLAHARLGSARPTELLDLPVVPHELLALVSSFGAGVGGLILIVSSFVGGIHIVLFAVPAAAVPVLGPRLGLPGFGGLDPSFIPSIIGAGLLAAGLLFGRSRR